MTTATAKRDERNRDELRARIIEAALSQFAQRGYHGTTIPQVMQAAGVGAGSVYRLFESKEQLVNEAFREAKRRLEHALRDGLSAKGAEGVGGDDAEIEARALFDEVWARLVRFVHREPIAFRFLELQDHAQYLDGESRAVELAVLTPIVVGCMDFQRRGVFRADLRADAMIAMVWGAFVGLVKAERLGYLKLNKEIFGGARDACWRALARTTR